MKITNAFYSEITNKALSNEALTTEESLAILGSNEIDLFSLVNAAKVIREKHWKKDVTIHIINNAQNGLCPEDCNYCAQAKTSKATIDKYPSKEKSEVLAEAKAAYERGAYRYCMVYSGRGPSEKRVSQLADIVKTIKENYPIEVCVSAGLLNQEGAEKLKEAGVDRYNHNINTSESHYPKICSTHTHEDRLNTLKAVHGAKMEMCSGMIIGMGETHEDILEVASKLRDLKAKSIPINFLVPIEGNILDTPKNLTPEFCIRVLCLFRFLNPASELRAAAGREIHLRSLEVLSMFVANSLFMDGYLNTKGSNQKRTLQMLKDAGLEIKSEYPLETLLKLNTEKADLDTTMKSVEELRPVLNQLK